MKNALIAHDKKKEEIIELAKKYKDVLAKSSCLARIPSFRPIMSKVFEIAADRYSTSCIFPS